MTDAPPTADNPYPWAKRRRFMYLVSLFCAGVIVYVLVADKQGAVADTAMTMAFLTLMANVGSYVFGASWQDIAHMKTIGSSSPYEGRPPMSPRLGRGGDQPLA